MKNRAEMLVGKLRPNQVPERPWQHILVDFIMKLPVSKSHDSILVVCDRFLKMSHFVATTEKTMAEGLARLFRDNVWKLHGLPESVISDRGPQEEFVREMKKRHEEARVALVRLQEEMKRQANRSRKEIEEYRVGDKVLISTKDFLMELMKRVTKKLTEKFIGPYVVKKIVSENVVELELLVLLRIHPVVNVRRIVKYREQVKGQKKIPPPSVEVASEKEYEVEEILNREERRGKTKYLVKWKGYIAEENTWEGLENLKNVMKKVEEFEKGRFEEEIQRIRMKKGKEMKLNPEAEEFKRGELPGRYMEKLLYGWDDKKFEEEYLKKLERNWNR